MSKKEKRQFDLSHHKVAESLQGRDLAPFGRRLIAFALDSLLISLITTSFWFLLPAAVFVLILVGKAKSTFKKGRSLLHQGLEHVDDSFANMAIEEKVRHRFKKYMTAYIKIAMYAPIVISGCIIILVLYNIIAPESYIKAADWFNLKPEHLHSIESIFTSFSLIYSILGGLFYFTFFTWKWQGRTPGKKLMKIQVVKLDGNPITLLNSFERFSGYTASASLLLYGFFQYFWDSNHQTTHDKIVETVVLKV